jgi:aryl-alcohol dehydrogenase-like predicted oxidoreductase
MEYIKIKGLNKPVSKLIMGTAWFNVEYEEEIFKMLDLYVEKGGTVIDTGKFYGAHYQGDHACESERILKKWLDTTGKRDQLVIMDKACHPIITPNGVHHPEYWRVKPDIITDDLHYSLLHTGCDYFDIYLLHRDDPSIPVGDIMDRLEQHRLEGLIKTYGVSNWEQDRVEAAIKYCEEKGYQGLSVNNPSYSLAHVVKTRWPGCVYADDSYASWHKGKDITLFSWAAQGHGFFADIYNENAPQDIKNAFFTDENFERLARAKILGEEKGVPSINIALAYVLDQDFDVCAIIGSRDRHEFDSCLDALKIKLTESEINYLSLKTDNYK